MSNRLQSSLPKWRVYKCGLVISFARQFTLEVVFLKKY